VAEVATLCKTLAGGNLVAATGYGFSS